MYDMTKYLNTIEDVIAGGPFTEIPVLPIGLHMVLILRGILHVHIPGIPFAAESGHAVDSGELQEEWHGDRRIQPPGGALVLHGPRQRI